MKTFRFKIFGHDYETKVIRREDTEIVFSVNGQEYKAYLEEKKSKVMAKATPKIERPLAVPAAGSKKTTKPADLRGAGGVVSPLPGQVVKINVKVGDSVKAGDTVVVLEAMKMQNQIQASIDGVVDSISVAEGEAVSEGQDLLCIKAGS